MNVCGSASSVSPASATSELHSRPAREAPARRASSSTTRKPTLWRVSRYSSPGLPNPRMRRAMSRWRALSLGLRLLDDLGLRLSLGALVRRLEPAVGDGGEHLLGLVEQHDALG